MEEIKTIILGAFIGAILSYFVYAIIQIFLIKKMAYNKYITKYDNKNNIFKQYTISMYENKINKILFSLEELNQKLYLNLGKIGNKIGPSLDNYINNLNSLLINIDILKSWAHNEAHNEWRKKWDGKPVINTILHNKELENIRDYLILDKCYVDNKSIIIKDENLKNKFHQYLLNIDININIKTVLEI